LDEPPSGRVWWLKMLELHGFYSAAALLAMQSAVIPTTIPSVRPSVTRWYPIGAETAGDEGDMSPNNLVGGRNRECPPNILSCCTCTDVLHMGHA